MFHNSFSAWGFNKHGEESWVIKHSSLCTVAFHKMQIERCSTCHENTFIIIRNEDHEILKKNVRCVFNSRGIVPQA